MLFYLNHFNDITCLFLFYELGLTSLTNEQFEISNKILLAQYLLDNGLTKIIYVNQLYSSPKLIMPISHTWLLVE